MLLLHSLEPWDQRRRGLKSRRNVKLQFSGVQVFKGVGDGTAGQGVGNFM